MANVNYSKLRELLRTLVEGSEVVQLGKPEAAKPGYKVAAGSRGRILLRDGLEAPLEEFLDELSKDKSLGSKVHTETLRRPVWNLINSFRGKSTPNDDELHSAIGDLINSMKELVVRWTARVPIDNLVIEDMSELQVGTVTFRPHDSTSDPLKKRIESLVTSHPKDSQAIKLVRAFEEVFRNCDAVAEVSVDAENLKALELVNMEVDQALNLLRCYTHVLFARGLSAFVGQPGSFPDAVRGCLMFGAEEPRFSFGQQKAGALAPYRLTPDTLQRLNQDYCFDILHRLLAKPESSRNNIEKVLCTAVRWIGQGIISPLIPERVLNLSIALEVLMIQGKEEYHLGSITDRIARRLAFLLSEESEERIRIYERAKKLYGLRSRVAHAGKTDISTKEAVELESYSRRALIAMAGHLDKWKTHQQFVEWVTEREFS